MDRRDIIKRLLYPKCKTAIEFKFDNLIANPMLSYITIQDIAQLNKIATSIKYSSKPKEKYLMIDKILVPRGFKKMASGTNRVVYRFLNDYRIVLKVAIDKVGLSDNGNEYRIQHLLKPFVTKCFEVSPCGTVGLFERVVPITSREEFVNISEDVFDLINNLIGKYVLEDIGEKFYMNYGLREGFGPVLLDYPYVFELDGRKLICNVPDPMELNGYCGGEIDYDLGYNNLICTKCGKRYLATELKSDSKSENPKIIIKGDDIIMKCKLMRGNETVSNLNSNEHISTNTIKPRKQFDKLKTRLTTYSAEEEKEEVTRKPIKTHDEVNLKVRVKGHRPKGETIDEKAIKEQKIVDENTTKIPVSFESEPTVPVKEEPKFIATIKRDESEIEVVEPVELVETIDEVSNEIPEDTKDESCDTNEEILRVAIRGVGIWDLAKNKIIGYTNEGVEQEVSKYLDAILSDDEEYFADIKEDDEYEDSDIQMQESIESSDYIGNDNYKTDNVVSPIEGHYSSMDIKDEEDNIEDIEKEFGDNNCEEEMDYSDDEEYDIPEVVINPREENIEEENSDNIDLY